MTSHHPTGPDFQRDTGLSQPNPAALVAEALPRTVQNSGSKIREALMRFRKTFLKPKARKKGGLLLGLYQVMEWEICPSRKTKHGSDPTATRNQGPASGQHKAQDDTQIHTEAKKTKKKRKFSGKH